MLQYFYKKLEASWIFTLIGDCQDQVSQRQHKETELDFFWSVLRRNQDRGKAREVSWWTASCQERGMSWFLLPAQCSQRCKRSLCLCLLTQVGFRGAAALTASSGETRSTTISFTSWSSNTKSFLFFLSTSGAVCLETPGVFETRINITSECSGLVLHKSTAGKFCLLLFMLWLINPQE